MINNEEEIWKSHPDIVGIEVSTMGNVRTLDRVVSSEKYTRFVKGHVLKQRGNNYGYLLVNIPIAGKWTTKSVHRLVAQTFIANQDNLPEVNHRDCDRTNNNVSNLEWCTGSYNCQYREKFGEALSHPVFAINLTTLEVYRFRSQGEASRVLGVYKTNITKVIKGKQKQTGGLWFVNADEHVLDIVNQNLHDIGKTGLNIKLRV